MGVGRGGDPRGQHKEVTGSYIPIEGILWMTMEAIMLHPDDIIVNDADTGETVTDGIVINEDTANLLSSGEGYNDDAMIPIHI
ncbi:hypothetical protein HAX54_011434 [Datura stramonium]|uniref:Uncharacterized protein n=1 Tax=Datura stramonium TaxID=4076 RepID=A0ABS8RXR6_DATST|nr:hypothetical protein [Datura stramonium]